MNQTSSDIPLKELDHLKKRPYSSNLFRLFCGLIGCLWLTGPFGLLIGMGGSPLNEDIHQFVFIQNWIPWLSALAFATGWLPAF